MLSSPGDIYVKNVTLTMYCGDVWGEAGGDQDVARLVLTWFGIAVSEIFEVIREDSRCCVQIRISAPQIASNRSLLLLDRNILFARANAF